MEYEKLSWAIFLWAKVIKQLLTSSAPRGILLYTCSIMYCKCKKIGKSTQSKNQDATQGCPMRSLPSHLSPYLSTP